MTVRNSSSVQSPVRDDLTGFLDDLEQLPTLSPVAVRLIEATASEETGIREIVRLIETDQPLVAKVLKIANSPHFGSRQGISTIERAAGLLGKDLIRSIVLSASVFDCFRPKASDRFNLFHFWSHSAAVAIASEILARRLGFGEPMEAFVAGLLHDMGKLILAYWDRDQYEKTVAAAYQSQCRLLEMEEETLGIGHTSAALRVMEKWRFPRQISQAAWLHHQPLSHFGEAPGRDLGFIVKCANCLSHLYRIGDGGNTVEYWSMDRLAAALEIRPNQLDTIAAQVVRRFEEVSSFFDWEADSSDLYLASVNHANQELAEMQIAQAAAVGRLERRERVLEATYSLNQSLDQAHGMAEGLNRVLQAIGSFLPHAGMVGFIAVRRSKGLEGCIKATAEGPVKRYFIPLPESRLQQFGALPPRRQIDFLLQALRTDNSQDQESASSIIDSDDLVVLPLSADGTALGYLLVQADTATPHFDDWLALGRKFAQSASLFLHRMLLTERLRSQSEELAQIGRKIEETERRLFHSERLASVGRLAAGAAHEINNPLTIIAGHAELLLDSMADESDAKPLREILRQASRISEITSQMMGFARPAEPRIDTVALPALLERTLEMLDQRIRLANVEVHKDFDEVPDIAADPKQLEQVFLNLMLNAVQAMPQGGDLRLRIGLDEEGKGVQIDIHDSGVGIAPQDLSSIFDPFFTTKSEREGTGLGLAICLTIVRNHGGRILVSSSQGQGSTFRILLPRGRLTKPLTAAPQTTRTKDAAWDRTSSQSRILAVDDEPAIREIFRQALEGSEIEIDFASDGEEALEMVERRRYDLVLLDLRMPKKAGMEVLEILKTNHPALPVIVVSGVAHPSEFEAARKAGAFDCIRKPFKMSELRECVVRGLADA